MIFKLKKRHLTESVLAIFFLLFLSACSSGNIYFRAETADSQMKRQESICSEEGMERAEKKHGTLNVTIGSDLGPITSDFKSGDKISDSIKFEKECMKSKGYAYVNSNFATLMRKDESAAKQGDKSVFLDLGRGYYDIGDYKSALKWLEPIANEGNSVSQNYMGLMYDYGRGVTQSYELAVQWYKLAAEQGEIWAQGNLGRLYEKGFGVDKDILRAYMWRNISSTKYSKAELSRIATTMSPDEIKRAEQLSLNCRAKNYNNC